MAVRRGSTVEPWIFDHSSCHKAMAADTLDVSKMNVKPGGAQPKMHDTVWAGQPKTMCLDSGEPNLILEERGINTTN